MKTDPNEPAFPHPSDELYWHGVTVREFLAAKNFAAIIGKMVFDQPCEDMLLKAGIKPHKFEQFASRLAVSGADALIAALNEEAK